MGLRSWAKGFFSNAAANGGGSTGPDKAEKAEIVALQGELNTFTGDPYQQNDVVTPQIKDLLGRVQGATIAIALAYDAAPEGEEKQKFVDAGLVSENPFTKRMQVNAGVIFDAKDKVDGFTLSEEKITAWAEALEAKAKEFGATDDQIAEGLKLNETYGGIDPSSKDATKGVEISPIYNAIDPNLGSASKTIAAFYAAFRSGYGDIQTGNAAKGSKFNISVRDDDPKYLKRLVHSAEKIHAFINEKDGAFPPSPEDMNNVRNGLIEAVRRLKDADQGLGDKADLTNLVKKFERYSELTSDWRTKLETKAEAKAETATGPAKKAGLIIEDGDEDEVETAKDPYAAIDAELAAAKKAADDAADKVKKDFNGPEANDAAAIEEKVKYIKAIGEGIGADNLHKDSWVDFTKSDFLPYLVSKTDITSSEAGKTVLTAKDGSYSFSVTAEGVTHDDTNNDVSAEEALISANLIKLNSKAYGKNGVTIGGTDEQKAMYAIAMKIEAPDIKINNQDEIDAISPEIKARAQSRFESLLDERMTPEDKPDYKSIVEEEAEENRAAEPKPEGPKPGGGGPTGGTRP